MSPTEELKASISSLDAQIQDLTAKKLALVSELKEREKAEAQEAMARILSEIKALNLDPAELAKSLGLAQVKKPQTPKAPSVAGEPKYRSSIDPKLTWTGKGRKPAWINTFLENGGDLSTWMIK